MTDILGSMTPRQTLWDPASQLEVTMMGRIQVEQRKKLTRALADQCWWAVLWGQICWRTCHFDCMILLDPAAAGFSLFPDISKSFGPKIEQQQATVAPAPAPSDAETALIYVSYAENTFVEQSALAECNRKRLIAIDPKHGASDARLLYGDQPGPFGAGPGLLLYDLSEGAENFPIPVFNEYDSEVPSPFHYIARDYVFSVRVRQTLESQPLYCSCSHCAADGAGRCGCLKRWEDLNADKVLPGCPYDAEGRVLVSPDVLLVECSRRCHHSPHMVVVPLDPAPSSAGAGSPDLSLSEGSPSPTASAPSPPAGAPHLGLLGPEERLRGGAGTPSSPRCSPPAASLLLAEPPPPHEAALGAVPTLGLDEPEFLFPDADADADADADMLPGPGAFLSDFQVLSPFHEPPDSAQAHLPLGGFEEGLHPQAHQPHQAARHEALEAQPPPLGPPPLEVLRPCFSRLPAPPRAGIRTAAPTAAPTVAARDAAVPAPCLCPGHQGEPISAATQPQSQPQGSATAAGYPPEEQPRGSGEGEGEGSDDDVEWVGEHGPVAGRHDGGGPRAAWHPATPPPPREGCCPEEPLPPSQLRPDLSMPARPGHLLGLEPSLTRALALALASPVRLGMGGAGLLPLPATGPMPAIQPPPFARPFAPHSGPPLVAPGPPLAPRLFGAPGMPPLPSPDPAPASGSFLVASLVAPPACPSPRPQAAPSPDLLGLEGPRSPSPGASGLPPLCLLPSGTEPSPGPSPGPGPSPSLDLNLNPSPSPVPSPSPSPSVDGDADAHEAPSHVAGRGRGRGRRSGPWSRELEGLFRFSPRKHNHGRGRGRGRGRGGPGRGGMAIGAAALPAPSEAPLQVAPVAVADQKGALCDVLSPILLEASSASPSPPPDGATSAAAHPPPPPRRPRRSRCPAAFGGSPPARVKRPRRLGGEAVSGSSSPEGGQAPRRPQTSRKSTRVQHKEADRVQRVQADRVQRLLALRQAQDEARCRGLVWSRQTTLREQPHLPPPGDPRAPLAALGIPAAMGGGAARAGDPGPWGDWGAGDEGSPAAALGLPRNPQAPLPPSCAGGPRRAVMCHRSPLADSVEALMGHLAAAPAPADTPPGPGPEALSPALRPASPPHLRSAPTPPPAPAGGHEGEGAGGEAALPPWCPPALTQALSPLPLCRQAARPLWRRPPAAPAPGPPELSAYAARVDQWLRHSAMLLLARAQWDPHQHPPHSAQGHGHGPTQATSVTAATACAGVGVGAGVAAVSLPMVAPPAPAGCPSRPPAPGSASLALASLVSPLAPTAGAPQGPGQPASHPGAPPKEHEGPEGPGPLAALLATAPAGGRSGQLCPGCWARMQRVLPDLYAPPTARPPDPLRPPAPGAPSHPPGGDQALAAPLAPGTLPPLPGPQPAPPAALGAALAGARGGWGCPLQVVQRGMRYRVEVFRTHDRGWGVRAGEPIPEHAFVCLYLGELISAEEGDQRGRAYDRRHCSTLFDLDLTAPRYTVDCTYYSNVARFINHDHNPNLDVYKVFIDCDEPEFFYLGFFTSRPVGQGEELSFDYRYEAVPRHAPS
ncbi:putative histone-lysine N-methyltransferase SUV39H1 [Paratrimastix pyriformis]|uniref:Histone-lysine N-methyltransferase SUV39H1 n=1 Tax=Paratrimastix pyriformis TaxID=342808 RepID=A0ABQ8UP56_9EUKA|nr:putative histone-lysine N-methyltransferase SUV39H1 [Paratrimastix pyriformis]